MSYDPFARGPLPVGVRTRGLADPARGDRPLPTELWYPATDDVSGQDVGETRCDRYTLFGGVSMSQQAVRDASVRSGLFPLVVFSHGFASHRRQSTFFCTHLASHGYVVAAVDHTGNTVFDLMQAVIGGATGPDTLFETIPTILEARPRDVSFVLESVLTDDDVVARVVDGRRVALAGHSLGGWTALTSVAADERIRATVCFAPSGTASSIPGNPLRSSLDLDWGREVPTLLVVAERDSLLPLAGMHELVSLVESSIDMIVIGNADHLHFCDGAEAVHELYRSLPRDARALSPVVDVPPFRDLCPEWHAHDAARGAGLTHLDAHVRDLAEARALAAGGFEKQLRARGIRATRVGHGPKAREVGRDRQPC